MTRLSLNQTRFFRYSLSIKLIKRDFSQFLQDVFQIVIIVSGLLAIMIRGLMKTGGLSNVWSVAEEGQRIQFFNPSLDPFERHTFVNLLFGSIILWGSPYIR